MANATDPLRALRDRLDAGGYEPHGAAHAFRARCPVHDGDNGEALSVSVGADGRALAHCHAHNCAVEAITDAVGLTTADLFPAGHDRARRLPIRQAQRKDFTGAARDLAHVLYVLQEAGETWRCELILQCPNCGSGTALFVVSTRHRTFMSCENGCTAERVAQVLAGQLADREAKR